LKIVFVGRMGAGKSTAIRQVSSITPVNTDVKNLSGIESSKAETTVGIDYGRLQLENDCWVNLFGVPGQERFRSLWGVVSRGADGIVLLVNNSSAQPIDDCKEYLEYYSKWAGDGAIVVGITHYDQSDLPHVGHYMQTVQDCGLKVPILPVDVREQTQVVKLIKALIVQLEALQ
ncbi:MAG: 50S ribosome-binding GTPase, partial [Candidatus Eremiobacteraeota bacterium]|nr:50S ribosome-binding GTPase [Candidatus Eremiobacteraeota bacterium]